MFDPDPPPLPDRFPHRHGGTVIIRMNNGEEFRSTCASPRGSGPRGVEWADVEDKYRALVPLAGLAPRRVDESLRGDLLSKLRSEPACGAHWRRLKSSCEEAEHGSVQFAHIGKVAKGVFFFFFFFFWGGGGGGGERNSASYLYS